MISRNTIYFVAILLSISACSRESAEPSATDKALQEIQNKYDELVQDRLDEPVKWAQEDLENIGDWEYRVETASFTTPEDLTLTLNDLGDDKWEVIWIEKSGGDLLLILKRPSVSYLSRIPLSQIGKFIVPGADSGE